MNGTKQSYEIGWPTRNDMTVMISIKMLSDSYVELRDGILLILWRLSSLWLCEL